MTRLINKALTEEPSVSPPILVKSASPLLENGQLGTFQVPEARPLLVAQQLDIGNKKLGNLETWFQKKGRLQNFRDSRNYNPGCIHKRIRRIIYRHFFFFFFFV